MAKKPKSAASNPDATAASGAALPDTFEADAYYKVRVARAFQHASTDFSPAHAITVKGRIAAEIREHLVSAEAV